jgi:hypothetical protein
LLSRPEEGNRFRLHRNRLAIVWIASKARVAPPDGKGAKAAQFDPIAARQCRGDAIEMVATMVSTPSPRSCVLAAASSAISSALANAPAGVGFRNGVG